MNELRKDPTRGQWVLVRPAAAAVEKTDECPFCPGNESLTPSEIAAYRKEGSQPNSPGWQVRVIPELDPYFRVEWELVREGVGMYDKITPRGASELIIESPSHDDTLATMGEEQLEQILWMYRDRIEDLKRDPRIRDTLITRQHRKPGSRISHPYSRVTAIPIIFDQLRRELQECRTYYQYKRRCVFCDVLRQEVASQERVVRLTPFFLVLVPYAARAPLETWILPRQHHCAFEAISAEAVADLARLLSGYFQVLARDFGDPGFEMSLHTVPNLASKLLRDEWATVAEDYHSHLEILVQPERLKRLGGIFISDLLPEEAARQLRQAWG
ncbi:MAG: galactose-1-phosphate uridylyltransferase [Candidatus Rokubacteria bacterium]|nr:galactose-1-phosphate uridylyltransferase [Candidatus Rokubacteria bacterium]